MKNKLSAGGLVYSTEAGRKKLEPLKVQGYAAYDAAAFMALGAWLGL